MKIIFNNDGSLKYLSLDTFINQGDNLTKFVEVAIEGRDNEDYTMSANFQLPNGEVNSLIASEIVNIVVDGTTYEGRKIALTSAQTLYKGIVKMSLKIVNLQDETLFTYATNLTINPTVYDPDELQISNAQWDSLMQLLNQFALKKSAANVRTYQSLELANADIDNLENKQIVIVLSASGKLEFYQKQEGEIELVKIDLQDLVGLVPGIRTIAGLSLENDISADDLKQALDIQVSGGSGLFGLIGSSSNNSINFDYTNKQITIPANSYIIVSGKRYYISTQQTVDMSNTNPSGYLYFDTETQTFGCGKYINDELNVEKPSYLIIATWWGVTSADSFKKSIRAICRISVDGLRVNEYGEPVVAGYGLMSSSTGNPINFNLTTLKVEIAANTYLQVGGHRYLISTASEINFNSSGAGYLYFDTMTGAFGVDRDYNSTREILPNRILIATWWQVGSTDVEKQRFINTLKCEVPFTIDGERYTQYHQSYTDFKQEIAQELESPTIASAKILVIGDSISDDNYQHYDKWVTKLCEAGKFTTAKVTNISKLATGFIATGDGQPNFITRLEAVTNKETYDLVIVFGGINDYIQSVPFGESGDDRTVYFKPAVDYFFQYLVENFTQARICVLSPLRTHDWSVAHGGKYQKDYIDYIKEVAKSYSLPLLNLTDESGFCPTNATFKAMWTNANDGVHPNETYENKYLSKMIYNFVKNLM